MPDARIAKQFAGYHIESRLGRGGMGVVYKATDVALDRTVALKVLSDELAEDPSFRQRFITESKIAASLDHPNIVPIFAAGEWEDTLYIAMRFVDGDDLLTVLRAEGRLDPVRAARIIAQVAAALDASHSRGLIHRDVKPSNVLLAGHDHVYLTDFGISKRMSGDDNLTQTAEVLGTIDYLAPEQIRRDPLGPATDVYALGCLTYHLLTGEVPFPYESADRKLMGHVTHAPPRPSEKLPALGTGFDILVRRAMSKAPADRYPTAGALAGAALASVDLGHDAAPTGRAPVPLPPKAPSLRGATLVTALTEPFNLIVLVALLVAGVAVDNLALMLPLALLVYAAAVLRSFHDDDTRRRAERRRR